MMSECYRLIATGLMATGAAEDWNAAWNQARVFVEARLRELDEERIER